jgi:hypothetical protein
MIDPETIRKASLWLPRVDRVRWFDWDPEIKGY